MSKCIINEAVRVKNWVLSKNNLTGCSSDIRNGYATSEQQFQTVVKETEKAVLCKTCKGEFWFPKSTIVERKTITHPSFNSPCRKLEDLVYHCEFVAEELGISFSEALERRIAAIDRWNSKKGV